MGFEENLSALLKRTRSHSPPYLFRWWGDNQYKTEYLGPDSIEEYREYWEDIDDYEFMTSKRNWKHRPKTFYYRVLKQLRKKIRRNLRNNNNDLVFSHILDEEASSFRRIMEILQIPVVFDENTADMPADIPVLEPLELPRIYDINRSVTEDILQLPQTLRNLVPVRNRMVGDYFNVDFDLENVEFFDQLD